MKLPTDILLVEDDEVEIMSVQRALRIMNLPHRITVARDGLEALEILRGEGVEGGPVLRSDYLIFLDINMPRMNGLEFLRELRRDPQHARASVIILTTSMAEADRQAASEANATGYIVKSAPGRGFLAFAETVRGCLAKLARIQSAEERPGELVTTSLRD